MLFGATICRDIEESRNAGRCEIVIVQPLSPDLSGDVRSVFGAVATRTPDLTDSILRLQENRPQLIGLDPEVFA